MSTTPRPHVSVRQALHDAHRAAFPHASYSARLEEQLEADLRAAGLPVPPRTVSSTSAATAARVEGAARRRVDAAK